MDSLTAAPAFGGGHGGFFGLVEFQQRRAAQATFPLRTVRLKPGMRAFVEAGLGLSVAGGLLRLPLHPRARRLARIVIDRDGWFCG